jgi:hypothetical protein
MASPLVQWTGPVRVNTGVSAIVLRIVRGQTMRYSEICARPAAPDSHPFTADIAVNPATFGKFERTMEDRRDVRLLARIDRPDGWVVHVACTTERVRTEVRDTWG